METKTENNIKVLTEGARVLLVDAQQEGFLRAYYWSPDPDALIHDEEAISQALEAWQKFCSDQKVPEIVLIVHKHCLKSRGKGIMTALLRFDADNTASVEIDQELMKHTHIGNVYYVSVYGGPSPDNS